MLSRRMSPKVANLGIITLHEGALARQESNLQPSH
jgi:hypothetical protein